VSLTREGDIYLVHALAILADLRRMDEAVSGGAAMASNDGDVVPGRALDGHGILIRWWW
jgi:DNA-binding transcriptional LysR family regulator